jgi:hypothetical protein
MIIILPEAVSLTDIDSNKEIKISKTTKYTNKEINNNKTTEDISKEILPIKKKNKDTKLSTATKILLITGAVGLIGGGAYAYYSLTKI